MIYKVCTADAWAAATARGSYAGSSDDDRRDGFIHLSTGGQLRGTLDKHFAGQSDLLLIAIKTSRLGRALQWEPSRGGALFPHLYGELPMSAVEWTCALATTGAGRVILPDLAGSDRTPRRQGLDGIVGDGGGGDKPAGGTDGGTGGGLE